MVERDFQPTVIKLIEERVPGCVIVKNDPNYRQGFPDLSIYYEDKYAILETKKDEDARYRPNQKTYLEEFARKTYARRIEPENAEEVIDGLCEFFGV
jgi:hypothetical protein